MQYPDVDLLSTIDPAQSASANPWISNAGPNMCLVYRRPLLGLPFKYPSIQSTLVSDELHSNEELLDTA